MEVLNNIEIIAKEKVKFFVSTKADLISDKVNDWINEMLETNTYFYIKKIDPFMSYTSLPQKDKSVGAYMIGCMVHFEIGEEVPYETDDIDDTVDNIGNFGLDFPS